ncbi:hypothetical protein CQW23_10216 [Capsicum baccatum]|uniref:Uncharacterized protein n=1 Tax=Capsicum baccatum TaxID=33114 RepID=A0A2G2WZ67_CAPBA|nr:hypothetical protein CQW23_10216 [Capsicum baccatum]
MNDIPTVSFCVALHLAQIKNRRKFIMFDYGSAVANMEAYGFLWPLDFREYYFLIDILVDLFAGRNDKVIRPSMVRKHYKMMKDVGMEVSYNEFECFYEAVTPPEIVEVHEKRGAGLRYCGFIVDNYVFR